MQAQDEPLLIAISIDSIQNEPYVGSDGLMAKSADIHGTSTDADASFQLRSGLLNPDQIRLCELLKNHGFTVVEVPEDWRYNRWKDTAIKRAMDRVNELYPNGKGAKKMAGYDTELAQAILIELNKVFPERTTSRQLKYRLVNEPSDADLLSALEALQIDGLISGTALKDYTSSHRRLVDMAGIQIKAEGRKQLSSSKQGPETQQAHSMRRTAEVLNILIASPSDVTDERNVVEKVILDWNSSHFRNSGVLLHPMRWETHTYPASGNRPQAIINKQIVESGDVLIGIFGYKLGTPTGVAQSGTIEEIEEFRKAGKYVALYFSTADVPRNAGRDQLEALEAYKNERKSDTLYFEFEDASALRKHLTGHLPNIIADVQRKLGLTNSILSNELSLPANAKNNQVSKSLHLEDLISELEDNLDCALRPRTGDVYRRPSNKIWLANRNKISLPPDINQEVKTTYSQISSWFDVVASGLSPLIGNLQLDLTVSDLRQSLPSLIDRLKKLLNS